MNTPHIFNSDKTIVAIFLPNAKENEAGPIIEGLLNIKRRDRGGIFLGPLIQMYRVSSVDAAVIIGSKGELSPDQTRPLAKELLLQIIASRKSKKLTNNKS